MQRSTFFIISLLLAVIIWLGIALTNLFDAPQVAPPQMATNPSAPTPQKPIETAKPASNTGNLSNNTTVSIEKVASTSPAPIVIPDITFDPKTPPKSDLYGPNLPGNQAKKPIDKSLLNLPDQPSTDKDTNVLYDYEGRDEEKYKVKLGVAKDGYTVQTKMKTDRTTNQVELEGVEIEIKLPK